MLGKVSRGFWALTLIAVLSSCNSTSDNAGLPNPFSRSKGSGPIDMPMPESRMAPATGPAVVQAYCPQVVMLEQSAVHRAYAGGGQDDPDKLLYQASLADATRQCSANETTLTINVVAQGRVVQGPAGKAGQVTLPILVEVIDGENVIYSQKVSFPVEVQAGGGQFIFNKPDVQIPNAQGGATRFTRVRLGFDAGPAKKPARPRRG